MSSEDFKDNYQPKTDFLKAAAVIGAALAGTVAINHSWVADNQVSSSFFEEIYWEMELLVCADLISRDG